MSRQEIRKIYRTAQKEEFPNSLKLVMDGNTVEYSKVHWQVEGHERSLRYGTNPHQRAALYKPLQSQGGIGSVEWAKWGKDGPSATNIEDGSHGLRIVRYFDLPAVAVMKHLNPSGVAVGDDLARVYARARHADPRAAFGSVVVMNRRVDETTATEIASTFVEVVYAPGYDGSALTILNAKKDVRLGVVPDSVRGTSHPDIVVLEDGSLVLEDSYRTNIRSLGELKKIPVATRRKPSATEEKSLLYAWWTSCEVRSNAVVFWKDNATIAVGTGQQDRIGAIEACIEKAHRYGHDLKGSVMASDGFLPKMDNVEAVAKEGVSAIIQPGGSIEDSELVGECDRRGISMVLTGERSFRHF